MALLPAATGAGGLADSATTQGQQKTNFTDLRSYLSDLLGTDSSNKSAARAALGTITNNGAAQVTGSVAIGSGGSSPPSMTNVANAALNTASNIAGGAPAASGSTDANVAARLQAGSVALDFGVRTGGELWVQPRLGTNYATNFPLELCPNGSEVQVGGSLRLKSAVSQLIPGATSFAVRNNANTANNLLVSDAGAVTARTGIWVGGATGSLGIDAPAGGTTRMLGGIGALAVNDVISGSAPRLELTGMNVSTAASAGSQTLPANPAGFLIVSLNGASAKIPYYGI